MAFYKDIFCLNLKNKQYSFLASQVAELEGFLWFGRKKCSLCLNSFGRKLEDEFPHFSTFITSTSRSGIILPWIIAKKFFVVIYNFLMRLLSLASSFLFLTLVLFTSFIHLFCRFQIFLIVLFLFCVTVPNFPWSSLTSYFTAFTASLMK